jgi:hypothetical protein
MGKVILILLLVMSVVLIGCTHKKEPPLVHFDSKDYGDANRIATATELERNGNTSKIKVVFQKRGGSVGDSVFVMMAVCEVASARNYEYFTNLKEWDDKDGGRIYLVGFTNNKDADINKEFGSKYDYTNESGHKRIFMSVSPLKEATDRIKTEAVKNPPK